MLRIGKNAHKGERCFVVASGPSTKNMDLSKLRDEVVICVNESYKILDWDPTYIAIGDYKLWPHVKDTYSKMSSRLIVGSGLNGTCGDDYNHKNMKVHLPLDLKSSILSQGFHWDFKTNPSFRKGYNVISEIVLPFVCWAGFRECYLIGCDCTENGYAFGDPVRGTEHQKIDNRALECYGVISKTGNLPTQIFNSTVGGRLESFPRIPFEKAIIRGIDPSNLIVVGYYTPDRNYKDLAENMKRSVERFGLCCKIYERPSLAKENMHKPMPWVLNCSQCGDFILEMLRDHPKKHILYLDADATMEKTPSVFFDKPVEYDFAATVLTNRYIANQLQSNTLFFANTPVARKLAREWRDEQNIRNERMLRGEYKAPYFQAWDQQVLQDVLAINKTVKWVQLPWTYAKLDLTLKGEELMPGINYDEIVIAQHQASRQNKRFI